MPNRVDPIPELKQLLAAELTRLTRGEYAWIVATTIGTDQPRVSNLRSGKLERFSLEALIRFMARLDYRVELRFEKVTRGKRPRSTTIVIPSQVSGAESGSA